MIPPKLFLVAVLVPAYTRRVCALALFTHAAVRIMASAAESSDGACRCDKFWARMAHRADGDTPTPGLRLVLRPLGVGARQAGC